MRPRLRLRTLLVVVAVALGSWQARRRWARYRIEAAYHAYWEAACREVAVEDEREAVAEMVRQAAEKRQEAAEHARKRRDFGGRWW